MSAWTDAILDGGYELRDQRIDYARTCARTDFRYAEVPRRQTVKTQPREKALGAA
jgi:hypothetical protein